MKHKLVNLPPRTVIVKTKNANYAYLTTGVHYSKELKRSAPHRIAIGKLDEASGLLIPNDNYFDLFGFEDDLIDPTDRYDVMTVGPHFIVKKIVENLQLDELLFSVFQDDANKILDIATYMMMSENNVMQYFEDYGYSHTLFNGDNFSDTTICELFNRIKIKDIDTFIHAWVHMRESKGVYISYDSTNMNCVAGNIEMAEYGHAKDNDELPQVNVSLGYDQTNGTPMFYELYPGSIVDNSECKKMVDRAKHYGMEEVGFILDRGYFSKGNIRYFEEKRYDYLIMSKSNAKFIAAEVEKNKAKLKNGYSHYIEAYELYGITEKGKILGTEKEQYVHIYYNGVESEKEKLQINKRFALMDKKLEELKGQIIKRAENLSSYKKYYKLKYDENGYFMGYQRDEKAIRKEIDNTGYFAIVSSREMKAEEALRIYRDRDAIEKIFRMEKSYLGNDVFRVHSSEKLESKVFVTFIALIIRNEIYKAMKGLYQKNKKEYTVPKVLKEIERLGLTKLSDEKYHMRYNLTKKQKQILKELKGSEAEYKEFIREIKSTLN